MLSRDAVPRSASGGILRGWSSIAEGYLKLFGGPATVRVTFHDFTRQGSDDWYLFVGREHGVCTMPTETLDLAFRTTRWFIEMEGVWRQLHHHGSRAEIARQLSAADLRRPHLQQSIAVPAKF